MRAAGFLALDAGVLLLEGRDLAVHGEADDALLRFVGYDSPGEFEAGVLLGGFGRVVALVEGDDLVLGDAVLGRGVQELVLAVAVGADGAGPASREYFLVVGELDFGAVGEFRERALDVDVDLELAEDVEAVESAVDGDAARGGGEEGVYSVVEDATCRFAVYGFNLLKVGIWGDIT